MKRLFFQLLFMVMAIAMSAQISSGHLTFKGVPIDGTREEFVSNLTHAGFAVVEELESMTLLRGSFLGYNDWCIGVSTADSTDMVHLVSALVPYQYSWNSLINIYEIFKGRLTAIYGKPREIIEHFKMYEPVNAADKLICLKMGQCAYCTTYEIEAGFVQLSLGYNSLFECYVKIQYWDRINTAVATAKETGDL